MSTGSVVQVDSPRELRALDIEQLDALANDLRGEIIRVTASNGGHLATNLGCVELTMALHYTLNSPRDRIFWDVGNQCYTHKMLTGRRDRFATIRQSGGLSGFMNRMESAHDPMTSGHAGTAISSALGAAHARDYLKDDYRVAAIVGDGAMTTGLSYEALNNLVALRSQFLLLLNDNSFSISPTRGAVANALTRARSRIMDGEFFAQLGLEYFGPIDGHDIKLLIEVLDEVAQINHPVVLHVITCKGKGYDPAENDPVRFHGVSPFDIGTGRFLDRREGISYSDVFGRTMLELAGEDSRVMAITAAMSSGTGLTEFARQYPNRFFDVGIAEQHAVTMAGGLALGGCRPVVAIYSAFLQRSYDQVIHDVCLQDLPVTFVLDRAGIVGADGPTHHGVFDMAYLRVVPNMVVMTPKDGDEFANMLRLAVNHNGPAAIRTPRAEATSLTGATGTAVSFSIGQAEVLQEGNEVGLLAVGSMVSRAMGVAAELAGRGISARVVNARFIKPLDEETILETARQVKHLFTIEEHVRSGGFGSAVIELLEDRRIGTPVTVLGLPDEFMEHGSSEQLLHDFGLSQETILSRILAETRLKTQSPASPVLAVEPTILREAIQRVQEQDLPAELNAWVDEYEKVGKRNRFLWKWCLEGVRLTTLPCVDPHMFESVCITKVLGVMFDVLLDDPADQSGPADYLEQLLKIPWSESPPDFSAFSEDQQSYAGTTCRVWGAIAERVRNYAGFDKFRDLWRYDYLQLLNAMRYSHLLNGHPQMTNMTEHDLYLPHNMHMMVSGTVDLMCSSGFDHSELGRVREAVWHAQYMGRIGNLITTWERELADRDFTSGIYAFALQEGILEVGDLFDADRDTLRKKLVSHDCESYFLNRWRSHRDQLLALAPIVRTVDLRALVAGLERLIQLHLGSRGLK